MNTLTKQIAATEADIAFAQAGLIAEPESISLKKYLNEQLKFLEVLEEIVNEKGILEVLV